MTNQEIIINEIMIKGINFDYDGNNLKTYAQWKKEGKQVKKGSKALLQCDLWTPCKKIIESENVETGTKEKKQVKKMYLKKSSLFSALQVE